MRQLLGAVLGFAFAVGCAEVAPRPAPSRPAPAPAENEGVDTEITSAMAYQPPAPGSAGAPAASKKKKKGSDCGYHPICIAGSELCHTDDDGCERCTCNK